MKNMIYLDYAAATPLDDTVRAVMEPYLSERFFNPSATYLAAQTVRKDLEHARARLAHWLGARPSEIVLTAGGTEANNLSIHGVMSQFADGEIVTSSIEHESVLRPAHAYTCHEAPVAPTGTVDVSQLASLINDKTVLVSVMYANNEVGTVQPIRQISLLLEDIRKARRASGSSRPLYLHVDAAQAAAYLDLHVARLGVDMMTINAGKIYGPKQCGLLFVDSSVRLNPQVLGGGQERGVRSGTENVSGVIGFAAALELVQTRRHEETARLQKLQQRFYQLLEENIPGVAINGSRKTRLPNNVHITIPGTDNERLLIGLDEAGVLCAAGSACSASNEEPSHVLRAMGISDANAQSSLRFTMGRQTTETDIETAIAILAKLL